MNEGRSYVRGVQYQNANGQLVFRAMGLSDIPGGAGSAGVSAVLFGAALMLTWRKWSRRMLATGTMVVGLAAIFLSHVRASLVMLIVCAATLTVVLAIRRARVRATQAAWRRREAGSLTRLLAVLGVVAVFGFTWAIAVGAHAVIERFSTLTVADPGTVYHQNRGHFIEESIQDLLPKYPLGAGLGRWGMMNHYFGDNSDPNTAMLWSEEQFTAWLVDGGVPLIFVYLLAVAMTTMFAFRLALKPIDPELAIFAAVIFSYDTRAVVAPLGYSFFCSPMGIGILMFYPPL